MLSKLIVLFSKTIAGVGSLFVSTLKRIIDFKLFFCINEAISSILGVTIFLRGFKLSSTKRDIISLNEYFQKVSVLILNF